MKLKTIIVTDWFWTGVIFRIYIIYVKLLKDFGKIKVQSGLFRLVLINC